LSLVAINKPLNNDFSSLAVGGKHVRENCCSISSVVHATQIPFSLAPPHSRSQSRLDYQPLFGKGARVFGEERHERAAEIEPIPSCTHLKIFADHVAKRKEALETRTGSPTLMGAKYEIQNPQLVVQHCFVAGFGRCFAFLSLRDQLKPQQKHFLRVEELQRADWLIC